MASSSIIKYIEDTLSQGYRESDIRTALMKQGWSDSDISEAIKVAKENLDKKEATGKDDEQAPPKEQVKDEQKVAQEETKQQAKPDEKQAAITVKKSKEEPKKEGSKKPGEKKFGLPEGMLKGSFILSVVGGIIIILNSVLVFSGIGDILDIVVPNIGLSFLNVFNISLSGLDNFLINIIIGGFLIATSYIIMTMPDKMKITGMFMIILSLISVMIGNGFLLGGIIAIVGGVFAFLEK